LAGVVRREARLRPGMKRGPYVWSGGIVRPNSIVALRVALARRMPAGTPALLLVTLR
jgi:hypothetical protein